MTGLDEGLVLTPDETAHTRTDHPLIGMCGCLGICTCPAHSAVSAAQALAARRAAIPRRCRLGHLVNFGSPAVPSPGAETRSASSYEQHTLIWRLDRLPALQTLWEPEMGANLFRRPRT
jgi:hypothetical protein